MTSHQPLLQQQESANLLLSEFECPILHMFMKDPVFAEDGHTYERSAIQHWFDTGNSRSPITNEELQAKTLVANHSMRKMISNHRRKAGNALVLLCKGGLMGLGEMNQLLDSGADPNGKLLFEVVLRFLNSLGWM
jgi:hypothetical protein